MLFAALYPVQVMAAQSPPRPGTYAIGQQIHRDSKWVLAITTVEATRSTLKINVLYQNVSSSPQTLTCTRPLNTKITVAGKTYNEVNSYCSKHPHRTWRVPAGKTFQGWAEFPNLKDGKSHFSVSWYDWGVAKAIRLPDRSGLLSNPKFLSLMQEVQRFHAPAICITEITQKTRLAGYPVGTLWGLSSHSCFETVAKGAVQGVSLYQCIHLYPWMTCLGLTRWAHPKSEAHSRVDLSSQRVTVNGMGPLRIGMNRSEAQKAIGLSISEERRDTGRHCTDHIVKGGPKGLYLRFAQNRLVAIYVVPPSMNISTASGVHIGTSRSGVLETYAGETTTTADYGGENIIFAPVAPKFGGRIIMFDIIDGAVASFIAGERDFATGSCGASD